VHPGQPMLKGKLHDASAVVQKKAVGQDQERLRPFFTHNAEGSLDVFQGFHRER